VETANQADQTVGHAYVSVDEWGSGDVMVAGSERSVVGKISVVGTFSVNFKVKL